MYKPPTVPRTGLKVCVEWLVGVVGVVVMGGVQTYFSVYLCLQRRQAEQYSVDMKKN